MQELKSNYRDSRLPWFEVFYGMYTDQQDVSVLPSRATGPSSPLYAAQAIPVNVAQPIVDTAEAKIAGSTRPRPFFKAVGGNWSQKRKCMRLQKFIDGEIDRTNAYEVGSKMVKDAGIFGTAACKIYVKGGKICLERVLPSELLVDENLAFDADPRELTQCKEVSKRLLLRQFGTTKENIRAIKALTTVGSSYTAWSELVEVYETWSLAEGTKGKKGYKAGRHVITIPGATLVDEEYERDYFPIVIFRWSELATGFYGQGLIHQIMGLQTEISRWFRNISQSLHLLANPRVILPEQGNINPNHLTNAWGTVLKYRAPWEPKVWTSAIMPPEVYAWFENMYRKAFERTGLSTQATFATKQPGIDSGKAIREMSDIQADRLAPISVRYQNLFLGIAIRFIDCAEEIFLLDPEFSTVFSGSKDAERLRYADVRLDKNDYTVQLMAAAFLGRTPGAAYDDIKDMMAAQLITTDEARSLMQFPDLDRIFDLDNASRDNLERQIELILDKGLYLAPQPYDGIDGLELGKRVYKEAYARARMESVEETKLDLFRRYLDQTVAMIADENAKQPPPQDQGGEAPPQGLS